MRLVDIDKVIEKLEKLERTYRDYIKYESLTERDKSWYGGKINGIVQIKSILADTKETPTAYDVDKVVEQLRTKLGNHRLIPAYLYDEIEEIVREGGVNDI